jgi:hypothetical protein
VSVTLVIVEELKRDETRRDLEIRTSRDKGYIEKAVRESYISLDEICGAPHD